MFSFEHSVNLSLRKGRQDDAAIHRVSGEVFDLSLRFPAPSGSPRAYALAMTRYENGTLGYRHTPGLRMPGMAHLGCRPFGPSPPRSAFPFRNVRHPSEHCSLAIAVGNQHGSL